MDYNKVLNDTKIVSDDSGDAMSNGVCGPDDASSTEGMTTDPDLIGLSLSKTGLELLLGHCSEPALVDKLSFLKAASQQGTLNPKINTGVNGGQVRFEFAEHRYLGDILELPEHNNASSIDKSAAANALELCNGLRLTYGQINGLAGDFFGTRDPICQGRDDSDRRQRFATAFSLLTSDKGREVATKLLEKLKRETEAVEQARREGKSVADVYAQAEDKSFDFDKITKILGTPELNYIELAKINYDHFGENARIAYEAGHALALAEASHGTLESLKRAYAINAFADHFLEDSFASGHMRVPREALAGGLFQNACAKLMHDEENRLGVYVHDSAKQVAWYAYGDSHLFDANASQNLQQCLLALKQSIQEVYDAYRNKNVIGKQDFQAFQHSATRESITSKDNNFAPLFQVIDGKVHERKDTSVTVANTDRANLSRSEMWSGYEPVVGRWSLSTEASWAITAYKRAPEGTIKKMVYSWLKSKGIPVPW